MDLVFLPRILNSIPLLKNTIYNVYLEKVMLKMTIFFQLSDIGTLHFWTSRVGSLRQICYTCKM